MRLLLCHDRLIENERKDHHRLLHPSQILASLKKLRNVQTSIFRSIKKGKEFTGSNPGKET